MVLTYFGSKYTKNGLIQKRLLEWIVSSFDALGSGFEPDTCPSTTVFSRQFARAIYVAICPSMLQAEPDTELTLSASLATAVGQLALTMANWRYSTVLPFDIGYIRGSGLG